MNLEIQEHNTMANRARAAICRYLEIHGCNIIDRDFDGLLVFEDGDDLAFATVAMTVDGFFGKKLAISGEQFEQVVCKFFEVYDKHFENILDKHIRYDIIELRVIKDHAGVIRHSPNIEFKEE